MFSIESYPSQRRPHGALWRAFIRGRFFALHHIFGSFSYEAARPGFDDPDRSTARPGKSWARCARSRPTASGSKRSSISTCIGTHCCSNRTTSTLAKSSRRWPKSPDARSSRAARETRDGLTLHPLGDDWFLIRTDRATRLIWQRLGGSVWKLRDRAATGVDSASARTVTG